MLKIHNGSIIAIHGSTKLYLAVKYPDKLLKLQFKM